MRRRRPHKTGFLFFLVRPRRKHGRNHLNICIFSLGVEQIACTSTNSHRLKKEPSILSEP